MSGKERNIPEKLANSRIAKKIEGSSLRLKYLSSENIAFFGVFFILWIGLFATVYTAEQGTTFESETNPMIIFTDINFESLQIDSNPSDFNESAKFEVESKAGKTFTIYWEHNSTHLHAYVATKSDGYIAIGWRLNKPTLIGPTVMEKTNIIIGYQYSNGTEYVRDDYGISGNHFADTVLVGGTNDLLFSSVINDNNGVAMEFVYPLLTSDTATTNNQFPVDINLDLDGDNWAYFIMSATESVSGDLTSFHGTNRLIISKPVYLQKDSTDTYPDSLKDK
jgi:hypothetical protein